MRFLPISVWLNSTFRSLEVQPDSDEAYSANGERLFCKARTDDARRAPKSTQVKDFIFSVCFLSISNGSQRVQVKVNLKPEKKFAFMWIDGNNRRIIHSKRLQTAIRWQTAILIRPIKPRHFYRLSLSSLLENFYRNFRDYNHEKKNVQSFVIV